MSNRCLFDAHNQWATRPDDERFTSMEDLYNYAKQKRDRARQADMQLDDFSIENDGENVFMAKGSKQIAFTNWSFGQYCARLGAPAAFLSDLSAGVANDVLNDRTKTMMKNGQKDYNILFDVNEKNDMTVRSFNGKRYTRVWDYEVVESLSGLSDSGWTVPPSYRKNTFSDFGEGTSGLYCGDRDMFVFLVNEENRINDGSDDGLARGFFVSNSEVGAGSWNITTFLYAYICGNHIVWGAEDVDHIRVRHVGQADAKVMAALEQQLFNYQNGSVQQIEADIKKAKLFELGTSDKEVEDLIFTKRILPRKVARAAIEHATEYEHVYKASPWSAWGLSQGVTRVSQQEQFAEARVKLDGASDKILNLVN